MRVKWISAVPVFLALFVVMGVAQDQESSWPTPAEGWQKALKPGTIAQYRFLIDESPMQSTITVKEVTDKKIVISRETRAHGKTYPAAEETIDLSDKVATGEEMPPDATVKRIGKEELDAAGRTWDCTVFEIEQRDSKMKVWHCSEIPPIFMGGAVRMISTAKGETTTIILSEYKPGE